MHLLSSALVFIIIPWASAMKESDHDPSLFTSGISKNIVNQSKSKKFVPSMYDDTLETDDEKDKAALEEFNELFYADPKSERADFMKRESTKEAILLIDQPVLFGMHMINAMRHVENTNLMTLKTMIPTWKQFIKETNSMICDHLAFRAHLTFWHVDEIFEFLSTVTGQAITLPEDFLAVLKRAPGFKKSKPKLTKPFKREDLIAPRDFLLKYHGIEIQTGAEQNEEYYRQKAENTKKALLAQVGLNSDDELPVEKTNEAEELFREMEFLLQDSDSMHALDFQKSRSALQTKVNKLVDAIGYRLRFTTFYQCLMFLEVCTGKTMDIPTAVQKQGEDLLSWDEFKHAMYLFDTWKDGKYANHLSQRMKFSALILDVQQKLNFQTVVKTWSRQMKEITNLYQCVLKRLGFDEKDAAMTTKDFLLMWKNMEDIYRLWSVSISQDSCVAPSVSYLKTQSGYSQRYSKIAFSSYFRLATARDVTVENNNCLINSLRVLGFPFNEESEKCFHDDLETILYGNIIDANAAIRQKVYDYIILSEQKVPETYHNDFLFPPRDWDIEITKQGILQDAMFSHGLLAVLADMYNVHIEVIQWDENQKVEKLKQFAKYGDISKKTFRVFFCNLMKEWSNATPNHYRPILLQNPIADKLPENHRWGFVNSTNTFVTNPQIHAEAAAAHANWIHKDKPQTPQTFVVKVNDNTKLTFEANFHDGRAKIMKNDVELPICDFFHMIPAKK